MFTEHFPSRVLFVGMLGIAICACSSSDGTSNGTGGSSTAVGVGGSSTGGATGTGGTAVSTGGTMPGTSNTGGTGAGGMGGSNAGGKADAGASGGASGGRGGSTSTIGSGGAGMGGAGAVDAAGPDRDAALATGGSGGGAGGVDASAGGRDGAMAMGGSGGTFTGTCTKSKAANSNATGSGPHKVVVETNSDPGIVEGTIYRPSDLGGDEKYPIFVWGEGACSKDGLSNATAMAEIASHGYFVVADGTPNGTGGRTMDRSQLAAMGAPLIAYIDWAIAENSKPCSAYYQSLDTTKIASNGFSCGGLMSQATVMDPRIVTWGVTSSGMAGAGQDFYDMIHTPVFFVEGGTSDMAYDGAKEGYQNIAKLDVPVMWFSKDLGHGGDLTRAGGGDFTKLNLAWLNWWLKGDETATGKGLLVGSGCSYCRDSAWEVMSSKIP
jgi:hypothetical protein